MININGFNTEEQENITFEKGVDLVFQNVKKSLTASAIMSSSATFLLGLASLGIMGIGEGSMIIGDIATGDLAFNNVSFAYEKWKNKLLKVLSFSQS